jgi:hypothetical protein
LGSDRRRDNEEETVGRIQKVRQKRRDKGADLERK